MSDIKATHDAINKSLNSDIEALKSAQESLKQVGNMHDSKIVEILMLVAGELALREHELKVGEYYASLPPYTDFKIGGKNE